MTDEHSAKARTLASALGGDRRAGDEVMATLRASGGRDELLDDIAVAAAGGSTVALDLLLAAIDEFSFVRTAIRQLVIDPQTVDDVTQDVLIVIAEKIGTFRGDAKFTTWLHQISRFKAIDHLRRQRAAVTLDEDTTIPPSDAVRLSSMIASRSVIRDLIDELPDHYREAVILRDIERLTYDEIAVRAGIPLNTVKSRIARGRAILAARFATG